MRCPLLSLTNVRGAVLACCAASQVVGEDLTAVQSVMAADTIRSDLVRQEELNAKLELPDDALTWEERGECSDHHAPM